MQSSTEPGLAAHIASSEFSVILAFKHPEFPSTTGIGLVISVRMWKERQTDLEQNIVLALSLLKALCYYK